MLASAPSRRKCGTGTRKSGKTDAALYAVPAPRMMLQYRLGSRAFLNDMGKIVRSMLRLTERDFRRALRFRSALAEGPRRNLMCGRVKARLDGARMERVNALFAVLLEELAAAQGSAWAALHALTLAIAPLEDAG